MWTSSKNSRASLYRESCDWAPRGARMPADSADIDETTRTLEETLLETAGGAREKAGYVVGRRGTKRPTFWVEDG